MNPTLRVPASVSSLAHTAHGDMRRTASTLTGVTTRAGLLSAETHLKRTADAVREMRSQVRVLKRQTV